MKLGILALVYIFSDTSKGVLLFSGNREFLHNGSHPLSLLC
ncbi:hypothetical protein CDAR_275711, partial [Caerostris darwini]